MKLEWSLVIERRPRQMNASSFCHIYITWAAALSRHYKFIDLKKVFIHSTFFTIFRFFFITTPLRSGARAQRYRCLWKCGVVGEVRVGALSALDWRGYACAPLPTVSSLLTSYLYWAGARNIFESFQFDWWEMWC